MKLAYRAATDADFEFMRQTHHAAYRDVVTRQFGSWDESLQDDFFKKSLSEGGFEVLLCDGLAYGYIGLSLEAGCIYLRELVILPAYQGRGLGTACLQRLFRSAHTSGLAVRLQVLKANRAQQLYSRLGFREIGSTPTHIQMMWNVP